MKARVILIMVGLVGLALPLTAATIPVTTTDPAVAADGLCSLIEAIINANNDSVTYADCPAGSGADTIELASSATYILEQSYVDYYGPNGLPIVRSTISVEGHGSTIRRAPAASAFRIFVVNSTGALALADLTLEGGDSGPTYCGGALLNAFGSADLIRTTVTGSTAPGGGGVCNSSGPMTLTDSVVSFNTGSSGVGGVVNAAETGPATLVIEGSSITGNQAIGSGAGGIYTVGDATHQAELHISESEITDNVAEYSGGGVRTDDSVVLIEDSTISGNETFSATAYSYCAGIGIKGGSAEIRRCTINGNITESLADLTGFGGGVCVSDNTTIISNSTISGNEARGAATTGSMTGRGGGIHVIGGAFGVSTVDTLLVLEDSTICDNMAETVGGGISVYRYGGTMAVAVELHNTVVAENYEGGGAVLGNCVEETPAVITSSDFNLADDLTCNLIGTDDLIVADVMLAPLADNGGPTWTHLPETGSPAIDSGDDLLCPEIDQRGYVRPWDGDDDGQIHCDRGAVEHGAPFFADGFESGNTTGWSNTVP